MDEWVTATTSSKNDWIFLNKLIGRRDKNYFSDQEYSNRDYNSIIQRIDKVNVTKCIDTIVLSARKMWTLIWWTSTFPTFNTRLFCSFIEFVKILPSKKLSDYCDLPYSLLEFLDSNQANRFLWCFIRFRDRYILLFGRCLCCFLFVVIVRVLPIQAMYLYQGSIWFEWSALLPCCWNI